MAASRTNHKLIGDYKAFGQVVLIILNLWVFVFVLFQPRLLNKETKSIIEKISKADGDHTIAANVVFHTTGIMLSKHNIAYLSGLCGEL